MQPFFSIIIPTYNRAHLLPRAIISILTQTCQDWEVILVDDGSMDDTRGVVAKFNDPRIKYVYQPNAERSAARNNGINNSKGQFICFLDSDDYYLNNRLELLYNELSKRNLGAALYYTGLSIDREGIINRRVENQHADENVFDKIALSVIHSQQVSIHKKILDEFKYDLQFHIGEDMELWLRIAEKYPLIYLDDQFTIVAVEHEDRSVNIRQNSNEHRLRLLKYIFSQDHPGSQISSNVKSGLLSDCYFGIAKYYIYSNVRNRATEYVVKSILTNFQSRQFKFKCNVLLQLITFSNMGKVNKIIEY